ncbi:MAG: hypothetical protein K2X87_25510 [Gemmataceae bacterium]|nr:hypothetical protein [Gemmataceae bacterium]
MRTTLASRRNKAFYFKPDLFEPMARNTEATKMAFKGVAICCIGALVGICVLQAVTGTSR